MPTPSASRLYKPYQAISVQVPNDSANHQLLSLITAANAGEPVRGKFVVIQNDPIRSTAYALFGEAPTDDQGNSNPTVLSAINYGKALAVGSSQTYDGASAANGDENVNMARFWIRNNGASTGILWLNVEVVRG